MGRVVVLGSLIIDFVARAPRFPHPGEALIGDEFNTFLGGKGINQAVAAARPALRNASAAGALAASRMGAIPSLPTTTEMEDLLAHGEQLPTEDDQHPSGA